MLISNPDHSITSLPTYPTEGYTDYTGYTGYAGVPGVRGYDLDSDPMVEAARTSRIMVPALSTELQLDIDQLSHYNNNIFGYRPIMDKILRPGGLALPSMTPNHYHIYLALLHPLSESERICLQFTFGSDPSREKMNTHRLALTGTANILLFESGANVLEIAAWRSRNWPK